MSLTVRTFLAFTVSIIIMKRIDISGCYFKFSSNLFIAPFDCLLNIQNDLLYAKQSDQMPRAIRTVAQKIPQNRKRRVYGFIVYFRSSITPNKRTLFFTHQFSVFVFIKKCVRCVRRAVCKYIQ